MYMQWQGMLEKVTRNAGDSVDKFVKNGQLLFVTLDFKQCKR